MKVVVISNPAGKEELAGKGVIENESIEWKAETANVEDADIIIDLLFRPVQDRIEDLQRSGATCILVNHVCGTLDNLPVNFVRFSGWPGFLSGTFVEAAAHDSQLHPDAEKAFELFNKKIKWVPDAPGFIAPRVVAMVINEAYLSLEEGVSSREDVDTAMKLGTNYPFGPFEWTSRIGATQIHSLLLELSKMNKRYQPATLLTNEALS
jgi:3-hydroxybutyryl-CoA dehydrogenase